MNAIPYDLARQLCETLRDENRARWHTFNGLWCWGCSTFSGDPGKRCFNNGPDHRGCLQVNARYDRQLQQGSRK